MGQAREISGDAEACRDMSDDVVGPLPRVPTGPRPAGRLSPSSQAKLRRLRICPLRREGSQSTFFAKGLAGEGRSMAW